MSDKAPAQKPAKPKDSAWAYIGFGLLCAGVAVYLHNLFTDLETGAIQSTRLNVIIIFMYKTIGHIPTIIVIALFAIGSIIFGIRQLIMERRARISAAIKNPLP